MPCQVCEPHPRHPAHGWPRRAAAGGGGGRGGAAGAPRGAPALGGAAPPDLRGRPAALSPVRPRDARRRVHHPTARDRPDPHSPAPPCAPRPPGACAPAAPDGCPHRPLGVSRLRPRLWNPDSGVCGLHAGWLGAPLGPDPDPGRAGGRPASPGIRAPARARPPALASLQPPSMVHSASRTLGGPIEIPIPV